MGPCPGLWHSPQGQSQGQAQPQDAGAKSANPSGSSAPAPATSSGKSWIADPLNLIIPIALIVSAAVAVSILWFLFGPRAATSEKSGFPMATIPRDKGNIYDPPQAPTSNNTVMRVMEELRNEVTALRRQYNELKAQYEELAAQISYAAFQRAPATSAASLSGSRNYGVSPSRFGSTAERRYAAAEEPPPTGGLIEEYDQAIRDPRRAAEFVKSWEPTGLDKGGAGLVRSATGDPRFWAVQSHERRNEWHILPNRSLLARASALVADNGKVALEMLAPVFEIRSGPAVRLKQSALATDQGGRFKIESTGILELPGVAL